MNRRQRGHGVVDGRRAGAASDKSAADSDVNKVFFCLSAQEVIKTATVKKTITAEQMDVCFMKMADYASLSALRVNVPSVKVSAAACRAAPASPGQRMFEFPRSLR